jgi:hypothetical protein
VQRRVQREDAKEDVKEDVESLHYIYYILTINSKPAPPMPSRHRPFPAADPPSNVVGMMSIVRVW